MHLVVKVKKKILCMHAFSSGILKRRGRKMRGKHDVWICFVSSELSVHAFEKFGIKI